jgi:hypothetical protein
MDPGRFAGGIKTLEASQLFKMFEDLLRQNPGISIPKVVRFSEKRTGSEAK